MQRYLTIGKLTMVPGRRADAERIADQGAPSVAQLPGFENVTFFLDEERNEYGAVAFWASREDAERAVTELNPPFEQEFGDLLIGSIETRAYEIYEHKR